MLLQWESKILNKLYKTKKFTQLTDFKITNVKQLDYNLVFNCAAQQVQPYQEEIIECANTIIYGQQRSTKVLQTKIVSLDKYLRQLPKGENVCHVVIYSCLSKCKIWPAIEKYGSGFVPELVKFYKEFTQRHNEYLDFKYDPVILTKKYTNIMNRVKSKKKDHPKLINAIVDADYALVTTVLQEIKAKNEEQELKQKLIYFQHDQKHITHIACESSKIQIIQLLWKVGMSFEELDKEKQTPIFYAIKRGCMQILKFLVEEIKVNINHQEYFSRTPLYLASFEGNVQIVQYLYLNGADPSLPSKQNRTPLSKACYLGNVSVVEYLVKIGVDLLQKDVQGRTALHNCVWGIQGGREGKRKGHIKLEDSPQSAKILLDAGHPIEVSDDDGFTPLFSAVSSCAVRSVRLLYEYKANFLHKTVKQETVCFIAAKYGHVQILQLLIEEYGCNFVEPNFQGYSPLAAAITMDTDAAFIYLADKYVSISEQFNLRKLLSCKKEYIPKSNNLKYLQKWVEQNPTVNGGHLHQQLIKQDYIIFLQEEKEFEYLNKIMCLLIDEGYPPLNFIQEYAKKCTEMYNKGNFDNYIQFLQFLRKKKIKVVIENLAIDHNISENQLIKLLSFSNNLSETYESLRQTFFNIVKWRKTAVILSVLNSLQTEHQNCEGLYKYKSEQIFNIMKKKQEKQLNLIQFCSYNGINDIATLLSHRTQYKQKLSISIPQYEYFSQNLENNQLILHPIPRQTFILHELVSKMSEQEKNCYVPLLKPDENSSLYKPSKNFIIVNDEKSFQTMVSSTQNKILIGIDVQYFDDKQQQFVCCVQISHTNQVFLIDPFSLRNQKISQFLNKLFANEEQAKIFHAYDNDLRWLHEDFGINESSLKNVVDTSRIYMEISKSSSTISLKKLSLAQLKFEMIKDYQKSDWRLRPLLKEMVEYAAIDAEILPFIFVRQVSKLEGEKLGQYFHQKRVIKSRKVRNKVNFNSQK